MKIKRHTLVIILTSAVLLIAACGFAEETEISKRSDKGELIKGKAAFWRLKRDSNGVWWFLSPDGKQEFLNTVTTVQPFQKGEDKNGLHYVSRDYKGRMDVEHWDIKPDDFDEHLDKWAVETIKRVKDAGFKNLGGWCQPVFHRHDVAISRCLGIWSRVGKGKLFYDADWPELAEEVIKRQVVGLRDNTNLVGYHIDNELGWKDDFGSADHYFNGLAPDNPNRREVVKVMVSVWHKIDEFNEDWGSSIKSWEELEKWTELPKLAARARAKLQDAWLLHLGRDYLSLTTRLIRKYDPNHLILGVRFKGSAPKQMFEASRDYTDAMSINVYASDAKIGREMFESMYELSGQPIVITEYGFHSIDGRSGNRNRCGFVWGHVIDQEAKADGYKLFTTRFARVPYIIGADWFQWNDEPPSGRGDGEDVDFGIVDVYDKPYEHMVKAIRETTPQLNPLHAKSYKDAGEDIWQKATDERPRFDAAHLDRAPEIDADLGDWPEKARIPKMQHLEAIGFERAAELVDPAVYLGWTDEGLYIGVRAFDKDIDGYALTEESIMNLWRSRSFDCIEVYFSTRGAAEDQYWYDEYCHQFVFLPDANPEREGTIIQWHNAWDTLEENVIGHPDVKHAFKALSDGYTVELFIPAKALNGFDQQGHPEVAGNIFIRNWQPRLDYFWACAESIGPNKWGKIKLAK